MQQRRLRLGVALLGEERVAVGHLNPEVLRILLRGLLERSEIGGLAREQVPPRRPGRSALVRSVAVLRLFAARPGNIAQGRNDGAEALAQIPQEGLVEALQRQRHCLLEHLFGALAFPVAREHEENRVEAVVLLDPVADQGGLVVGKSDLVGELRPHEAVVELGDPQQLPVPKRGDEGDLDVVAPPWTRLTLLEHGEAFREPARNLRVGHEQGEGVRELVPERGAPVEVSDLARRGRVEGQHRTEAHAQGAQSGEPDRADRKVGVRRIELDPDRRRRLEAVAFDQHGPGLFRQLDHVRRQQFRLALVDMELEVLALDRPVLDERVDEVERVLDPDVVRVAREGRLQVRLPGLDLPQAKLVLAEQSVAAPGPRIQSHGLGREVPRLRVEPVLDTGVGEFVEQVGVARVVRQDAVAHAGELLVPPFDELDRRQHRPRRERFGIGLDRLLRLFAGLPEPLRRQAEPGPEHPGRDQVRVHLQGRVESFGRPRVAVEAHRARHRQQRFRMSRVRPQNVGDRGAGLGAVVLLEEQLPEPNPWHGPRGIERHGLVVGPQRVLEQLRIVTPQPLAGLGDRHEFLGRVGRAAIVGVDHRVETRRGLFDRALVPGQPRQLERGDQVFPAPGHARRLERLSGSLAVTVEQSHAATENAESRVRGIEALERRDGFVVAPGSDQRLHQQLQRARRRRLPGARPHLQPGDGVLVPAGPEHRLDLVERRWLLCSGRPDGRQRQHARRGSRQGAPARDHGSGSPSPPPASSSSRSTSASATISSWSSPR